MENGDEAKVLFRFFSDVLDQETIETMWTIVVDADAGHYQVDNIPFYIPFIATDDIISAEYDDGEKALTFRDVISRSGNSTVWIAVLDATPIDDVRTVFNALQCHSEPFGESYFAMEVRGVINYLVIRNALLDLKSRGVIDFAEPYLSPLHQF